MNFSNYKHGELLLELPPCDRMILSNGDYSVIKLIKPKYVYSYGQYEHFTSCSSMTRAVVY
jgi:hypothetical protein